MARWVLRRQRLEFEERRSGGNSDRPFHLYATEPLALFPEQVQLIRIIYLVEGAIYWQHCFVDIYVTMDSWQLTLPEMVVKFDHIVPFGGVVFPHIVPNAIRVIRTSKAGRFPRNLYFRFFKPVNAIVAGYHLIY